MKGDVVIIEEHHRRAAAVITAALAPRIAASNRRFTVTVAGESGSGKSETSQAIADALADHGWRAVVLGQDDYFVLPPKSNDARRRQDPEWLGPHCEVRMDRLDANLAAARAGADSIAKPLVDYAADSVAEETIDLRGVAVVIAEGTYASLLKRVDARVFIARSRHETLAHRQKRNRGSEVGDPFIELVLAVEHKIIAGHKQLADFVIDKDYGVSAVE